MVVPACPTSLWVLQQRPLAPPPCRYYVVVGDYDGVSATYTLNVW